MKKTLFLFVILLGFVSCEDETIEPTPPSTPTPTVTAYNRITVSSDPAHDIVVDSIVYDNLTTGFHQVEANIIPVLSNCNGIDYQTHNLDLTTNYISGDGCDVTVYFAPGQGYKIFSILLLKNGENVCDGAGGNGLPITEFNDSHTVTKNL